MKNALSYLVARLREPSTLAALSLVSLALGLPPGTVDAVAQIVVVVGGTAAAALPDK